MNTSRQTFAKARGLGKLAAAALLVGGINAGAATIGFEAETFYAEGGNGFDIVTDVDALGGEYITTASNSLSPGHTATYSLTFSEAGDYDLYAKIQVPGNDQQDGANDSFYAPDDFGSSPGWELVNGLSVAGQSDAVYHWRNITSDFTSTTYNPGGAGTLDFTISGREDGLLIDAFVLSTDSNLSDTDLDNAVIPEPTALALLGLGAAALLRRRRC